MRSTGPGYVADLTEGKTPEKSSPPAKPHPSLAPPVEEWRQEDEILADLILAAVQEIGWGRAPGGLHSGTLPGL